MTKTIQLLLADDDKDDCDLFKEALEELPVAASLSTVHDGEQLMKFLVNQDGPLPQMLFLDLNMPRKNGFECLSEIKKNDTLKNLPVIIFSTSYNSDIVNLLYTSGAHFYISKPNEFEKLKQVIEAALSSLVQNNSSQPNRENFVLAS
jgi:CheY-like chemotaxis protein